MSVVGSVVNTWEQADGSVQVLEKYVIDGGRSKIAMFTYPVLPQDLTVPLAIHVAAFEVQLADVEAAEIIGG